MSRNHTHNIEISRDVDKLWTALKRNPEFKGVDNPKVWLSKPDNFMLVWGNDIALFEQFGEIHGHYGCHILFESRGKQAKERYLQMANFAYMNPAIRAFLLFAVVDKSHRKAIYFIRNCLKVPVHDVWDDDGSETVTFVMRNRDFYKLHSELF